MTLNANALTTRDNFASYIGRRLQRANVLRVYHDGTGGVTSATVGTATSGVSLNLVTNIESNLLTLADYATMTALAVAINAADGWVATVEDGQGNADPENIDAGMAARNALLVANEVTIQAVSDAFADLAINAASQMIQDFIGIDLNSQTYKRWFDGSGQPFQKLPERPVTRILTLGIGQTAPVSVVNTDTDAHNATIEYDGTNFRFVVDGGSNNGEETIAASGVTDLDALVTAIDALTANWNATLDDPTAGEWLVSLIQKFGPYDALNSRAFVPYIREIVDTFTINQATGTLFLGRSAQSRFIHPHEGPSIQPSYNGPLGPLEGRSLGNPFPIGRHNIFVEYVAGYSTIPAAVEMACLEIASNLCKQRMAHTGAQSVAVDGLAYSALGGAMPEHIRDALMSYQCYYFGSYRDA